MSISQLKYPTVVFYRFIIAFGLGYLCTTMLSELLAISFSLYLDKAESIFLAAFISLSFYTAFVITSFCIQSLKKLTVLTILLSLCCFFLLKFIG